MLGNMVIFHDFAFSTLTFLSSAPFYQNQVFQKLTLRASQSFDTDQTRRLVGPDLGPNGLQRLSADDTSSLVLFLKTSIDKN